MPKGYLSDEKCMIALGRIPKASSIHKFGAREGIRNNEERTIWDNDSETYPWSALDTAQVLTITGVAGDTGKTIQVEGLDSDWRPATEEILVGDTGTVSFKRVFRAFIKTGATNEDDIEIRVGGASGTEVAIIKEGKSQTLMSIYTIPKGYTGLLMKGTATSAKDRDCLINFYIRLNNGDAGPFRIAHTTNLYQNNYTYEFAVPPALPEKTDLDVRVLGYANDNGAHITAAFDVILYEDNTDY